MISQGKFIAVEGLEGAGKTSAISVICEFLAQRGIATTTTREPGGTALAEKIRDLIKVAEPSDPLTDMAELLLLYAARVQLVENVIKPALRQGHYVIGDRHDMSSQAYQGGGRGIDSALLTQIRTLSIGDFAPALVLYLDIAPQIGLARARARGELDRIEQMQLDFFERTRARYLALAAADPTVKIINADQPVAQVSAEILAALSAWFEHEC